MTTRRNQASTWSSSVYIRRIRRLHNRSSSGHPRAVRTINTSVVWLCQAGQSSTCTCELTLFTIHSGISSFVGAVIDITERKAAEERIREKDAELQQILDLTPQLIAVYGPGRERLYLNRIALDYLGLTLEEWLQTSVQFAFIHPDDRDG